MASSSNLPTRAPPRESPEPLSLNERHDGGAAAGAAGEPERARETAPTEADEREPEGPRPVRPLAALRAERDFEAFEDIRALEEGAVHSISSLRIVADSSDDSEIVTPTSSGLVAEEREIEANEAETAVDVRRSEVAVAAFVQGHVISLASVFAHPASSPSAPGAASLSGAAGLPVDRGPGTQTGRAVNEVVRTSSWDDQEDLSAQFVCPICLEVCEDAVETPCCHNLFCYSCLLSKEHHIEKCPICKRVLQAGSVCANVPVRRMISDLPCSCRLDGCDARGLRRRDLTQHEVQCGFLPVNCPHSSECAKLLRSQLDHHQAVECQYRPTDCPMRCGSTIPLACIEEHLGRDCPRVLCGCEYCEAPVCRAELGDHIRVACPLAIISCSLMEMETQASCDHRCQRRNLGDHRKVCSFRPLACQHEGCFHVTTARLLAAHEEDCPWRRISCSDCGTIVHLGQLQEHLEVQCAEHVIPCPLSVHGCLDRIPRRLVDDHLQRCCGSHLSQLCAALAVRDAEIEVLKMEALRMREEFEQRLSTLEERGAGGLFGFPGTAPHGPGSQENGGQRLRARLGHPGTGFRHSGHSEADRGGQRGDIDEVVSPLRHISPSRQPSTLLGRPVGVHPSTRPAEPPAALLSSVPPPSGLDLSDFLNPRVRLPGEAEILELPRSRDMVMFPGPVWDHALAAAPPSALQTLMLLREGGVSQVHHLASTRLFGHGSTAGPLPRSPGGGVELPSGGHTESRLPRGLSWAPPGASAHRPGWVASISTASLQQPTPLSPPQRQAEHQAQQQAAHMTGPNGSHSMHPRTLLLGDDSPGTPTAAGPSRPLRSAAWSSLGAVERSLSERSASPVEGPTLLLPISVTDDLPE
ncbi:unnamed protein product [Polarella glacialis]|uniref:RING-type E3 ubiquitin transferase n=1 Tax=Polarella glacialis TaxID=89957 RepID=A0A813I169_POLGL|nr:unnamed protein product [Polarella glacialis]